MEDQVQDVSIFTVVSHDIWRSLPGHPVEQVQAVADNLELFLQENPHLDRSNTTIVIYTEHGVELIYHMTNENGMRTTNVHIMFSLDGEYRMTEVLIPSLVLAQPSDTLMVNRSRL